MKNDYKRYCFWTEKEGENIKFYICVKSKWIEVSNQVFATCKNSYRKINRDNARDKDIISHYTDFETAMYHYDNINELEITEKIYKDMKIETLYKVINMLPNDEQEIIILIYFEDKTEREVARILHLSNTTLHNKKIRILKKLKKILEQEGF